MDADTVHELLRRFMIVMSVIWVAFLFPSVIILAFASQGLVTFDGEEIAHGVLYYNLMIFPLLLIGSTVSSWLFFKKKHYWYSLLTILVPLLGLLVELIAADIALILN